MEINKEIEYQILLIEDDESDADLIRLQLKKLDINFDLEIIHRKEELENKLGHTPPDLIISDYNLPSYTGTEALKIVKDQYPDLPFILVSGYIGEENAVNAMLAGASDYVMKDKLDRLNAAVLRELSHYREQQNREKKLVETKERYQSLIQTVNGIVWEADADTFVFSYVSPQSKELLGYKPEEWYEDDNFWKDHIHPKDRERVLRFCHNQTTNNKDHTFEYRMIAADGSIVWLRDYVTVVTQNGKAEKLRGLMVDITDQKKAERQRDAAYEIADIGHWEVDLVNNTVTWSQAVKKIHEVDPRYEPGLETGITFYKEGEHRQKITEAINHAIETGEGFDVELKIVTAKGNELWVRSVGETEYRDGTCLRIFGSIQNINQRKETELKLREVVEHSTNMFYRHDVNHVLTYVSPQSSEFLGCPPDEAKKRWTEFVTDHPVNEEGFLKTQKAIETGEAQPAFPLQLEKVDGEIIWVRVNEAPITENGKTVAIVGSLTDITENKKFEDQLQQSLQRYEYVTKATSDAIWDWNLLDDSVYWGRGFETLFGYDLDKLAGDSSSWTDHIHPDDLEQVDQSIQATIKGKEQNWYEEYRYLKADGSFAYVEDRGFVLRDEYGKAVRMIGAMRDVTEVKQNEMQRSLQQEVSRHFAKDEELNDILDQLLPYLADFGNLNTAEIWLPSFDNSRLNLTATYANGSKGTAFYKQSSKTDSFSIGEGLPGTVWKDGELKVWDNIDSRKTFIRKKAAKEAGLKSAFGIPLYQNEEFLGILVFGSERNAINLQQNIKIFSALQNHLGDEIQRKQQEQQMQLLFESAPDILAITAPNKHFIRVNPAFCQLLGYTEKELTSQPYENFVHPEDLEDTQKEYSETMSGKRQAENYTNRWRTKSGDYRWIAWSSSDVFGKDNLVFTYGRDVTKQKEAETEIKEANKKLRTAQQIAKLGYWERNLETDNIYFSDQTYKIFGLDPDNDAVTMDTILDRIHPADFDEATEQMDQAVENREPLQMEHRILLSNRSVKWIRINGHLKKQPKDAPIMEGTIQDITEKKELEFLLNQTNQLARIGIWEIDMTKEKERPVFWSKVTREFLEVDKDYHPTLEETYQFFEEESRKKFKRRINRAIKEGIPFTDELLTISSKGNRRWVRCIGNPEFADGKCTRLYGSFQDIHERKVSELELASRNEFIEATLNNLPIGISVHHIDTGESILMNQQFNNIYGWPEEKLSNVENFFNAVYPDETYRQEIKNRVLSDMESGDPERMSWNNIRITTREGEQKIINAKNIPLFDQNQMISTVVDVTSEKEAEKEKVRTLERIGDAFFSVDENWTVTYWNREAEKVLGKPKEEIVGKDLWEEYEEAVSLEFYTQYHKAINEQTAVHFEEYYPPVEKWFEVNAYPSESGLSVFFRDITERKENEEQIRRINERFEKVTEATNDALWDFNVVENHLFWGRGFETLFGYDLEETNPSIDFLISLIHPEERERIAQNIEHYMKSDTKTDWYEEYRFKKNDGSYAYVMDRAIFIRDEDGEVVRVVGAMTDLSKQKAYEESLKELNQELQDHAKELAQSNAELEQFAYVASHDLQEPLRMVSSFLSRLEDKYGDQLDDKAQRYINFATDGAHRMRQIILDLLNYSRVGQGDFEREEIDLEELLEEILKLEQTAIADSGAAITWRNIPKIKAAHTPIRQVFQNLINNAIKYRKADVDPEIQILGEETKTHWKFTISDNGIGIREEYQENIFNIFQRLHTQDQYSGTGIGLAVSKKIVERHGGEIWVDSEEGEGSTFCFTIKKE